MLQCMDGVQDAHENCGCLQAYSPMERCWRRPWCPLGSSAGTMRVRSVAEGGAASARFSFAFWFLCILCGLFADCRLF